ncbi:MAG: class I SAM-dependent methyltransferase [Blastocatellia bacterium]
MAKTQKELAFLRDLYVANEWTRRFTELADKHVNYKNAENLLYINAGTGNHCFALREKTDEQTAVFASCEDDATLAIARDKAIAVGSDVDFSTIRFEDDSFDIVLADASLARPADIPQLVENAVRVARSGGKVTFFLPSAGSFGEVFSLLWEVMFNENLGGSGAAAEALIAEIPTISMIEKLASGAGLTNIEVHHANEVFEFENGDAFIDSQLVADFFLPEWLKSLKKKEKEQVIKKLAQLIDAEDGTLSFRFSVKATLITGKKI